MMYAKLAPHNGCRVVLFLVAAVVALLASGSARAASLTLFTDAPPDEPLVITPLDAADAIALRVVNGSAADPPAEYLTAWQLRLEIVPDTGAVGTLNFGSAVEPPEYVFDGTGHFGPGVAISGNRMFSSDFNFPATGGLQVPTAPGTGLLSITFAPSANAFGKFGVYALDGLSNCEWTDAASPVQHRRTFANVPDGGGPVRIADVLVTSAADYNRDGGVDAADYVVWRKNDGTQTGYDTWRANFGSMAGASGLARQTAPEPTTLSACWAIAAAGVGLGGRRLCRTM